jgi:uncharacterized protein YndB with AHSA1/START domain
VGADAKQDSTAANEDAPGEKPLHGSFTLSVDLAAPVERVFAAFSDLEQRRRWFHLPGKSSDELHELDFRVGGHELVRGTVAVGGPAERIEVRAHVLDVVVRQRIVYAQELLLDGRRRSVSLVTIELRPHGERTGLQYTEQYVFLQLTGDGSSDVAERKGGTRLLMNGLIAALAS